MTAPSIASNPLFGAGGPNLELGADRLVRASAIAASYSVDGVSMQGQSSLIENIGVGAHKGRLMSGRSVTGKLVFWLDGPEKQRLLRSAGGQPVTNLPDARAAARKALSSMRNLTAPTPEASGQGALKLVKMVTGYDRVNRQMRRGELVTVRGASGLPAFWLRGAGTSYPLRAADGHPITDPRLAEARADQLTGSGAATKLREVRLSAAAGAEFKASADRTSARLAIDLESSGINAKGGQGEARFGLLGTRFGSKGSALTCDDAVSRARAMGIEVQETNENSKGAPENARMHAWVQLTNDRKGGSEYANFTRNLSPGEPDLNATTYKLPANASPAFVEGYEQASRQIGAAQIGQVARTLAEGKATTSTARSNASTPVRVRPTSVVPAGRPVRRAQPRPLPHLASTRSSPQEAVGLLDSKTENSVTSALKDLPTTINGSPAWQGHCASYSGVVAKRIAGVDLQTPLHRGAFKPVAADNIEAHLATFGPDRQGLVRIGNRGHQFNWVTNNNGQAIFVDATTGRVGTKLSDIAVGLPPKLVTGDIQVNAFDLPH